MTKPITHRPLLRKYEGTQRRRFMDLYRGNARRRGVDWQLSEDDFARLTQERCAYCGALPSKEFRHRKRDKAVYVCNGLDRVDNDSGYVVDNVVACCEMCNFAKRNLTPSQFLSWAIRLGANLQRTGLL